MTLLKRAGLALACVLLSAPLALAQTAKPLVANGTFTPVQGVCLASLGQPCIPISTGNPLPVAIISGGGGGGGGGGDASSALQSIVQANPGADASKATAIQGVAGGKPIGTTITAAIPAGANAIGTVGVTALPALPAGANAIGTVGVTALPSLPAGANAIGTVGVTALPALPTGSNNIGSITNITGTVPLPTGAATVANDNLVRATLGSTPTVNVNIRDAAGVQFDFSAAAVIAGVNGTGPATLTNRLPVDAGVAQASTTSGQNGPLVQCAVTTAAPTYTTGQTSPISCDTSGAVRVAGAGGSGGVVTQPTAANLNALVQGAGPVTNGAVVGGSFLGGCVYNSTLPTLSTGQQAATPCSVRSVPWVHLTDGTNSPAFVTSATSTLANNVAGMVGQSFGWLYNGTNWAQYRDASNPQPDGRGVGSSHWAPITAAASAITTTVSATAAETSLLAKAVASNVYAFDCKAGATAGNCIAMNRTTVPSAGALTSSQVLKCVPVAAGALAGFNWGTAPRRFNAGVVILFSASTDCDTYTASSTAKITVDTP